MPNDAGCGGCRWFERVPGQPWGLCRVNPPAVPSATELSAVTDSAIYFHPGAWPAVMPHDWCGKYEPWPLASRVLQDGEVPATEAHPSV
jgi:hypothetical protein